MSKATLQPIQKGERAQILDVLRGLAILGIFIINLHDFTFYWILNDVQKAALPLARFDYTTHFLQVLFLEGKFYSIFSMLFGIGFAIFLSKSDQNPYILKTFRRRLLILFCIGFVHLLIWVGDIVAFYALLGFALIPFRKFSNKALLLMAAFCILSPIGWYALKMSNPAVFDLSRWFYKWESHFTSNMGLTKNEDFYNVFHGSNFVQRIRVNFIGILYRYGELLFQSRAFKVFGMFLIGLVIGRTKLYERLHQNRKLLWKLLLAGIVIGIPANYMMATLAKTPGYAQLTIHGLKQTIVYAIGVAPLALAYASTVALLFQHQGFKNLLQLIAPVGRMGLTNYIMQTLIGILTFSSLGFNFPSIGPTAWTFFAIAVFVCQITLSTIWLSYFQYGPLEWIWRQLTYGKRLPLTRKEFSQCQT